MDDQELKELKEAIKGAFLPWRNADTPDYGEISDALDEKVALTHWPDRLLLINHLPALITALESERAGRVRAERALDKLVRDLNDECRLLDSQSDALDAEDPDRQFLDGRYNAKAEVGSRVFQFRTGLTETLESHRELSDRLKSALAQSPLKETKP